MTDFDLISKKPFFKVYYFCTFYYSIIISR